MKTYIKKWLESLSEKGLPDEFEVKQLLRQFGIAAPGGIRLAHGSEMILKNLSPPFALKVCSGKILHKTDLGGVVLNLDESSLKQAVEHIQSRFPGESVLIEEQAGFKGIEFIVGALADPDFGPAVMAGMGGVFTELYEDAAFRLAPCTRKDALCMLEELTLAPVFSGFRGFDLDPDGLARLICKAGRLAVEMGDYLGQLDINPVVYDGKQWLALDAKLVLKCAA